MKLLNTRKNGDYTFSIYDEGTLIRESSVEFPKVEFPSSADVKVTNFCDLNCPFCHESSTTAGKHADLAKYTPFLTTLPAGTELALGGGNPLSHPDILAFLESLKQVGILANMTMNQLHFKRYGALLTEILNKELIRGLGISYHHKNLDVTKNVLEHTTNDVFHLIIGVHTVDDLKKLLHFRNPLRVLLLGYKEFGFGNHYYSEHTNEVSLCIKQWYQQLPRFMENGDLTLSFDNLAISQLNVKRLFTESGWNKFYMGDDATFTFYIDLVKGEYCGSSTHKERYPIGNKSVKEAFQHIIN